MSNKKELIPSSYVNSSSDNLLNGSFRRKNDDINEWILLYQLLLLSLKKFIIFN